MSRQKISPHQYAHLCQALHCDPQYGLDVRGLQLLYSDRISFLFSYCDVDSDGYLNRHDMHRLLWIVEGENRMMSRNKVNDTCSELHCDWRVGIDLPSLRKLVIDDNYYDLDHDFARLCNKKRLGYIWCKYPLQNNQMRDFSKHSDFTSLGTCVASSVVLAASTSTTCASFHHRTKRWDDNDSPCPPSTEQAICNTSVKKQVTRHRSECIEQPKTSFNCVPHTSNNMSACTAPSVLIPASVSAICQEENMQHTRRLSQLGMQMECPHCGRSIIFHINL